MSTKKILHPPKLAFGNISDDDFNRSEYCLTISQNSISLKNFGATEDIVRKYNYADVAGLRYSCPELQYFSRLEDRCREGSVHINSPPLYTDGPVIATVISQYGIGRPIEENVIGKKLLKRCHDYSVVAHLEEDTIENRIKYFNKCLFQLSLQMVKSPEYEHVKKFILPVGIGRRGVDDIWLTRYMPIISIFANDVGAYGKEVVLVVNKSYLRYLEKKYDQENNTAGESFGDLKGLNVLSKDELSLDMTLTYGEDIDVPDTQTHYVLN